MHLSRMADDETSDPRTGQAGCRPEDVGRATAQESRGVSQEKNHEGVDTMMGVEDDSHDVERR